MKCIIKQLYNKDAYFKNIIKQNEFELYKKYYFKN